MTVLENYLDEFIKSKEKLFGPYKGAGAHLIRKEIHRAGGTTWGYQLESYGNYFAKEKISGSSIGDDEIRIFSDVCQLVRPKRSVVIGNGFGISTFALALPASGNEVVAMDNWSEGEYSIAARDLTLEIIKSSKLTERVHIVTGTSPEDTPISVRFWDNPEEETIDISFIDGLHKNEAAAADFQGLLPFLDKHSIVLWHNVYSVRKAFMEGIRKGND